MDCLLDEKFTECLLDKVRVELQMDKVESDGGFKYTKFE